MSYNAQSIPTFIRLRKAAKYSIDFDLQAEGLELIDGQLCLINPSQVDIDDRSEIEEMSYKEFEEYIKPLSKGARFLAWRIRDFRRSENREKHSNQELLTQVAAWKQAREWLFTQTEEMRDFLKKQEIYPKTLVCDFNLRWWNEFDKFIEIYKECCFTGTGRTWRSCFQPDLESIRILATTHEYECIPLWVKANLINAEVEIQKDRIGDIWRLVSCSKAWKWQPELPKSIAERIGAMPTQKRIAAKYAWESLGLCYPWHQYVKTSNGLIDLTNTDGWHRAVSRSELFNEFWKRFDTLVNDPVSLLDAIVSGAKTGKPNRYQARQAEVVLGLPYQYLGNFDPDKLLEYQKYLDKDTLLKGLFGTCSKSVKKAWANAGINQVRWAIALAPKGNPDIVRQFLSAECVHGYEEEAVPFLQSLNWKTALRMIQTLTYKVRGEEHLVENFLIRDTGMLYNNLIRQGNTPNLGRVRCWLTCHEELGRQYITTLPNEPVKLPPDWKRVNGLCAVNGKWSIHLPTSTGELKFWGEQLHNCVGGYGRKINSGSSIVFTVRVKGQLTYCVEIDSKTKRCRQFSGNRHASADESLKDRVLNALSQAGLVNC